MENYLGVALVLFMGALWLGVLIKKGPTKAKVYLGALGFYILAGWYINSEGFRAGIMTGLFLFVLLFAMPFQMGGRLSRYRRGEE